MNLDFLQKHSNKIIFSFLFLLGAIFVFVAITNEVVLEKEQNTDLLIFKIFDKYVIRNRLTEFMYGITHFCSAPFVKIAYPIFVLSFVFAKQYRKALFAFLAGTGGMILVYVIKIFFQRPRPPYPLVYKETGYSFPSGHATLSFILYGTLAYFVWLSTLPKYLKFLIMGFLMLLSFTIGISRIYLQVHYPSDVLAGFCLGYFWLFLLIYFFRLKYIL